MNDLNTDNINATFDAPIARLTLTGPASREEIQSTREWFDTLGDNCESYQLYLEIPKMHFPDLGSVRKTFLAMADTMRGLSECGKCAVVTDSPFLRSTAIIEGTAMPQMQVDSFGIVELADAEDWLEAA